MSDHRDLSPHNGRAPPFAKPDPERGAVGTGSGYSGQEYDSVGQEEWRAAERGLEVAPDGKARGSGSPREEIDPGTTGSSESEPDEKDADDRTDSNGQENVEDRPNVGTVTPDDYPEQQ